MIDVEFKSGIAMIRMNHGKVNAMDRGFCEALGRALCQIEQSESRAAVLVGNDRVFSAGVDLVRFLESDADDVRTFIKALTGCFKTIFRFSKPLVAAINGPAVAGGCVLASACDSRIIHSRAKIGMPELRVGVPLPSIAIEIMRFAAAPGTFQAIVNLGKTYHGDEALRAGLADQVVERAEVTETAVRIAKELTAIPANVFEISKRQMRAPANRNVAKNENEFEEAVLSIWQSPANRNVIQEFVDKRF